jgi:2-polyprenyl-3-methyl-5-hydroxy-6-metoxy-1,4-benzoquinol methylase
MDRLMLKERAIAEELMDADDLSEADYAAAVHDLAKVNTITVARRPTLTFLDHLSQQMAKAQLLAAQAAAPGLRVNPAKVSLKILDVGFGDGDMLRCIARWANRNRVTVELVGIDLNPRSAPAAQAATPDNLTIDYRTGDYADLAGQGWDVILSSLVAHHMTRPQLVAFLAFMEAEAKRGWLVNDLHRHGFAWMGFPLLARLMGWHPIVRHDGRLSIARSYRPQEWPPILADAGVKDARIYRVFPFRLCVAKIL